MDASDNPGDRAASYQLLSQCFHPPDENLPGALRDTSVRGMPQVVGSSLEDIRKDYARLFVGPFTIPAPPYGSLYLGGHQQVCDETSLDVARRYRDEGLQLLLREPADHVAVELEYMYLLVFREGQAVASGDKAQADAYRAKQRDFLQEHLGAWLPALRDRVVGNAQTDFYKHVAIAADEFVRRDLARCAGESVSRDGDVTETSSRAGGEDRHGQAWT